MSGRRRAARARGLAALVALVALAGAAVAQPLVPAPEPPSETPAPAAAPAVPAAPVAPPGPAAIPLAEIAARVDPAQRRLVEILAIAEPEPVILEIEKQALSKEHLFHQRVLEAATLLRGEPSLDELDDIQSRARSAQKQLDDWQAALSARSAALDKARVELKEQREIWSLTIERVRAEKAPAELLERAKGVRTEIRNVEKQLGERFDAALKLQGLIAEESLAVSVLAQDVRRVRYEARGQLLERNRPPLVTAIRDVKDVAPVLDRVADGLERDVEVLRNFASLESGQRIVLHALLFLVLGLFAFRMRSWSRARRKAGKTLGPSEQVFDHPIATALLFGVMATPLIHPYLPRSYQTLLGLLLIVPILVLLPQVLAPTHRRVWYTIAALFLLDRVRSIFQPVELVERSIFLIETAAMGALAAWQLHRERFAGIFADRWHALLRAGLRFAVVALAISVVANLAGFLSLARLLGQGVLRSVTVGVGLYAAVNVARPLLAGVLRTRAAKTVHLLQGRRDAIERWAGTALSFGAAFWWLARTLDDFSLGDPVGDLLTALITKPLPLGNVAFSLGDVLLFFATAGAGIALSRVVRTALDEDVFPRTHLTRGVPHAVSATVRYAILIGAFLLAAAAAGFDWSQITLLAGAFGVGIGFGLQNIVNNFISGLILLYERPIQVGDTVEVGSLVGEVKRIGIRSSSVRTWQGAEVIVPNASLISEQVVNWTLSDRTRRIEIPVGVSYAAEPERVLALLEEVGRAHPDVMSEPAPLVVFTGFGDSSLNFELRVWSANFDRVASTRSEIALAVHRALRDAQIEIPFPQRDVHVTVAKNES